MEAERLGVTARGGKGGSLHPGKKETERKRDRPRKRGRKRGDGGGGRVPASVASARG